MADIPAAVRKWFKENGRKHGAKGGQARATSLTPARRRAIAKHAADVRWAKKRAQDQAGW